MGTAGSAGAAGSSAPGALTSGVLASGSAAECERAEKKAAAPKIPAAPAAAPAAAPPVGASSSAKPGKPADASAGWSAACSGLCSGADQASAGASSSKLGTTNAGASWAGASVTSPSVGATFSRRADWPSDSDAACSVSRRERKPRKTEARSTGDCGASSLGATDGVNPPPASASSADSCASVARAGRPTTGVTPGVTSGAGTSPERRRRVGSPALLVPSVSAPGSAASAVGAASASAAIRSSMDCGSAAAPRAGSDAPLLGSPEESSSLTWPRGRRPARLSPSSIAAGV